MTQFYAQPYDISATGFYFEDIETYRVRAASLQNEYGQHVEEFEIQFIDGDGIDCALASAWGLNQANLARFLEILGEWEDHEKLRVIVAVGECGYSFDPDTVDAEDFDVDLYGEETLRGLAERFVEDGLFGDIPESLQFYIDYVAIARDLNADYTEITIAGERLVYRRGLRALPSLRRWLAHYLRSGTRKGVGTSVEKPMLNPAVKFDGLGTV